MSSVRLPTGRPAGRDRGAPGRARPDGPGPRLRPLHPGRVARPLVRRPDGGGRPAEVHGDHGHHREGRAAAEDRVGAAPPAGARGGPRHRPPPARPAARRHAATARRPRSRQRAAARGVVGPEPQRGGGVLAWAMSAVAQLAETEAGTDETARQLRLTRESALVEEDALRAFQVTPFGAGGGRPRARRTGSRDARCGRWRLVPRVRDRGPPGARRTRSPSPCARPPGATPSSSSGWASTTGWRAGRRREREPHGRERPPDDPQVPVFELLPAFEEEGGPACEPGPSPGRSSTSARPGEQCRAPRRRACVRSAGTSGCAASVSWARAPGREPPRWRSAWPGRSPDHRAASCSSSSTCGRPALDGELGLDPPAVGLRAVPRRDESEIPRAAPPRPRGLLGALRRARGRGPTSSRRAARRGCATLLAPPTASSTTWSRTARPSSGGPRSPRCRTTSTGSSSWCARATPERETHPAGGRACSGRSRIVGVVLNAQRDLLRRRAGPSRRCPRGSRPRSFCASTANSIGSSLKTSLQKPFTIMLTASSAPMPRERK